MTVTNYLRLTLLTLVSIVLNGCGGSSGSGSSADYNPPVAQAGMCAVPRPASTVNPLTGQLYNDKQGTLSDEMAWIAAYVNQTYLWYSEVPVVSSTPYYVGNTVPYVDPTTNGQSTELLSSNYDVVDAYFNSQRTPLFTASGKPKDQFHFTYVTSDWVALSSQGNQAGFGFDISLVAASPPREAVVAYTSPSTPAAQNNIARGAQLVSVNGVSVVNGSDTNTLNEGLFSPVAGTSYTFQILDLGSSTPRTVTMTAQNITLTPVMNVSTLPTPNASVGYILYNDQIATAESELISAVNQLKSANNGAGIQNLVLDLRYNGGGYLDLASELAYMIAGPGPTANAFFEQDTYNNKNPFNLTTAQATVPFHNVTQGFSTTSGVALPYLNLSTVYVITGSETCSASEAIMNGLLGVGIKVIQVGDTTCGKPYGFYPQDNCSTTYFAIQFEGVNNQGFGAYADGFIPAGTSGLGNDLPGCVVADDYSHALGDPAEGRLAAVLQYMNNGSCPASSTNAHAKSLKLWSDPGQRLQRSPARDNRILRAS